MNRFWGCKGEEAWVDGGVCEVDEKEVTMIGGRLMEGRLGVGNVEGDELSSKVWRFSGKETLYEGIVGKDWRFNLDLYL